MQPTPLPNSRTFIYSITSSQSIVFTTLSHVYIGQHSPPQSNHYHAFIVDFPLIILSPKCASLDFIIPHPYLIFLYLIFKNILFLHFSFFATPCSIREDPQP